jgi:uridine kinase
LGMKRPQIVLIAGGSGSGKTSVARALARTLQTTSVFVPMDAYFLDYSSYTSDQFASVDVDTPDAFDLAQYERDIRSLAKGIRIRIPVYDFRSHRVETREDSGTPDVVISEGLYPLLSETARASSTLSVFLVAPVDVLVCRRILRNLAERSGSPQALIARYLTYVRSHYLNDVLPTSRFADLTLDTLALTPEECAKCIRDELAGRARKRFSTWEKETGR